MRRCTLIAVLVAITTGSSWRLCAADTESLLRTIKSVDREGRGNKAAGQAVNELSQQGVTVLPAVLKSFGDANPLDANYLRSAVEAITDRTLKSGKPLPSKQLEQLIRDKEQDPRARRLAFELLSRVDASAPDRLIPGMLLDPSPDFRRDAVARLIESGEKLLKDKDTDAAKRAFKLALSGATDDDRSTQRGGDVRRDRISQPDRSHRRVPARHTERMEAVAQRQTALRPRRVSPRHGHRPVSRARRPEARREHDPPEDLPKRTNGGLGSALRVSTPCRRLVRHRPAVSIAVNAVGKVVRICLKVDCEQ